MSRTAREAVRAATERLEPISYTPELDAELLMAHTLGLTRSDYLLKSRDLTEPDDFWPMVERRALYEPVAYILGHQPFWTIDLKVKPGVLIPRADSETLIEAAVGHFGAQGPSIMLDIGSGPGTLLLAALDEWPRAVGVGVERSALARELAEQNAESLGMEPRTMWFRRDWTEENWWLGIGGPFDLILCNPPYIEVAAELMPQVADYEPHEALFAGIDGLDDYRLLLPVLDHLLAPHGVAIFEIGWTQATSVTKLAESQGFDVTLFHDLGGRDRALLLKRKA